ncbi:SDR family NAD(P)-dependent oxidoreductase [candidate division KSB1 bacterium]
MNNFVSKFGPWALVTGASSGIGAEFCRQLAEKGLNIIMTARRKDRMEELADEIRKNYDVNIKIIPADLSKDGFLDSLLPEINSREIGLLINNAGFGNTGTFLDNNIEKELDLVNVNCKAPILLTHMIGKRMRERKKGGIVVVSSVLGFISAPFFANYTASKAFDLHFGEALHYELKNYGVFVQTLCPGLTATEFSSVSGQGEQGGMTANKVVCRSISKFGKKTIVIAGMKNRIAVCLFRMFPRRILTALINIIMRNRKKYRD